MLKPKAYYIRNVFTTYGSRKPIQIKEVKWFVVYASRLQSFDQSNNEEQISDSFDRLCKATYVTKLDLRSSYWQMGIVEGDEPKTTCVTRQDSYEFLVMPFGLANAPTTFCNLINDVLYEYVDQFVVVYLNDIVIYSESLEDHLEHLKKVLSRLREH